MIKGREKLITIILAYKNRNEEISDLLYPTFAKYNFGGEQVFL